MKKNVSFRTALNNVQSTNPLTYGVHDLKRAYMPEADILNTRGKLIWVDKQRNSIAREHLL